LTDSLNAIDAQRQAYDLEQQYVVAQENAAGQALYRSLGGGGSRINSSCRSRRRCRLS